MTGVLVIGEALVDVVRRDGREIAHPGGSPLNVAVALGRLGVPTILHSSFGEDGHGRAIARHLTTSDVEVTPGTVGARPTSVAVAAIGHDGAATYDFSIEWHPALLDVTPDQVSAVHTGSIATALEPGASAVERWLSAFRPTATVTFDPNVRPLLMGAREDAAARVDRLVAMADVVKASDEDVAWLAPGSAIEDVIARWLDLGAGLVVITRGGDGVEAATARARVRIPAVAAAVLDTIGAGDSFMAGLIAALDDRELLGAHRREELRALDAEDLDAVVRFAAACAAVTVSRPGADPPRREELPGSTPFRTAAVKA